MDAWMAFVSIIAIIAIVVVAGGLIAFLGHMVIGAFENDKKVVNNETIEYPEIKQLSNSNEESKEYNFEAINYAKAEQEKELAKKDETLDFEEEFNYLKDEDSLDEIENRLKAETEAKLETAVDAEPAVESNDLDEDDDLSDLDDLLDEISNDIVDEEKEKNQEDNTPKMSDELAAYSLDSILNASNDVEEESVEEDNETVPETVSDEKEVVENVSNADAEDNSSDDNSDDNEGEEVEIDLTPVVETKEIVEPKETEANEDKKIIEELKAQLANLNKQLEEARTSKTEVVTIDMTEDECLERLATLEERLKGVKREYKINMKEYRPLKKVMNDLEKYQTKLRRKDAQVAKKKVALYGVNNYVDIDKEKAEKLANELDLLDGLRLSVSHCEEVINANKDRFPILEHTNKILEDQIANIEADIASTNLTLQKIRDKQGNNN